jgi:hypothetical protein
LSSGERGDHVQRARAAGGEADADFAGGAGVAVGHVAGALLVADQDVVELGVAGQGVVDGQVGAAGVAEDQVNAFSFKGSQQQFSSRHSPARIA